MARLLWMFCKKDSCRLAAALHAFHAGMARRAERPAIGRHKGKLGMRVEGEHVVDLLGQARNSSAVVFVEWIAAQGVLIAVLTAKGLPSCTVADSGSTSQCRVRLADDAVVVAAGLGWPCMVLAAVACGDQDWAAGMSAGLGWGGGHGLVVRVGFPQFNTHLAPLYIGGAMRVCVLTLNACCLRALCLLRVTDTHLTRIACSCG